MPDTGTKIAQVGSGVLRPAHPAAVPGGERRRGLARTDSTAEQRDPYGA